MTERRDRVTAYHEAGHAIAALVLGIGFYRVSIIPVFNVSRLGIPLPSVSTSGRVHWMAPEAVPPDVAIIAIIAGPAAEAKYLHRSLDWVYRDGGGWGDAKHAAEVADPIALFREGERAARVLVRRYWTEIERLAEALIERGEISMPGAAIITGLPPL